MKADPELAGLPLTDEQRIDDFPQLLRQVADHLDSNMPNDASEVLTRSAQERGRQRRAQGYSLEQLMGGARLIMQVVNNVIYENLLSVNLSYLLLDLNKLHDVMMMQIEESTKAYLAAERRHAY